MTYSNSLLSYVRMIGNRPISRVFTLAVNCAVGPGVRIRRSEVLTRSEQSIGVTGWTLNTSKLAVINSGRGQRFVDPGAATAALCVDATAAGHCSGNRRWGTPRVTKVFDVLAYFDGVLTAAWNADHVWVARCFSRSWHSGCSFLEQKRGLPCSVMQPARHTRHLQWRNSHCLHTLYLQCFSL